VNEKEWLLFSGFESVENHMEFPMAEAFRRYVGVATVVSRFEIIN